jgi:hypothetical protein
MTCAHGCHPAGKTYRTPGPDQFCADAILLFGEFRIVCRNDTFDLHDGEALWYLENMVYRLLTWRQGKGRMQYG